MKKQNKIRAWNALKAEAAHKGLPKHYADDLNVHDFAAVNKYGSDKPFLWVLRECGTHLLPLDKEQYGSSSAKEWAEAIAKVWGNGSFWYLWNGMNLNAVTLTEAIQLAKEF